VAFRDPIKVVGESIGLLSLGVGLLGLDKNKKSSTNFLQIILLN
jgi:hypothetical protein